MAIPAAHGQDEFIIQIRKATEEEEAKVETEQRDLVESNLSDVAEAPEAPEDFAELGCGAERRISFSAISEYEVENFMKIRQSRRRYCNKKMQTFKRHKHILGRNKRILFIKP